MAIYKAVACFNLEYCLLLWSLHLEMVTLDLGKVQRVVTVVRYMGGNGLLHEALNKMELFFFLEQKQLMKGNLKITKSEGEN